MTLHRIRNNYRNRKNKWKSRNRDMFRSVFWALVAFELVKLAAPHAVPYVFMLVDYIRGYL